MFDVACTNEEKIAVTVTPLTPGGQPAQIDGPLVITVQSGDGGFEQDSAFPLVFKAVSGTAVADPLVPGSGETLYLVEGDANRDPNVKRMISDVVRLTVSSADAGSFGFSAGAAEPK